MTRKHFLLSHIRDIGSLNLYKHNFKCKTINIIYYKVSNIIKSE